MSYSYTREAFVAAAPAPLFAFLTDQSTLPLWATDVVRSEVAGGSSVEVGAHLRQVRKRGGREIVSDVEVIEHDPPRRHTVRTKVLGLEARFAFEISAREEGSSVRMTGEAVGRGLTRLLEKPLGKMMEKADDRALERLGEAYLREGRR